QDIQEVIEARTANEKAEEEAKAKGMRAWLVDSLGRDPDFLIKKPFVAFSFRCFGQNFDPEHSSGLDYEIRAMDTDYVFKGYQDQLEKIARDLQERYKVRRLRNDFDEKVVRFVTLWNYRAWQDSYHKEWDSEWELLGL